MTSSVDSKSVGGQPVGNVVSVGNQWATKCASFVGNLWVTKCASCVGNLWGNQYLPRGTRNVYIFDTLTPHSLSHSLTLTRTHTPPTRAHTHIRTTTRSQRKGKPTPRGCSPKRSLFIDNCSGTFEYGAAARQVMRPLQVQVYP